MLLAHSFSRETLIELQANLLRGEQYLRGPTAKRCSSCCTATANVWTSAIAASVDESGTPLSVAAVVLPLPPPPAAPLLLPPPPPPPTPLPLPPTPPLRPPPPPSGSASASASAPAQHPSPPPPPLSWSSCKKRQLLPWRHRPTWKGHRILAQEPMTEHGLSIRAHGCRVNDQASARTHFVDSTAVSLYFML